MVKADRPPANAFVAQARKVYNPIGFSKGYNFVLWFVFLGALFGFSLARLPYLDFWGVFCGAGGALPGECFYFTRPGPAQIGMILHLGCILPASLLACLQFIPVVRHKAIIVHRINGYLVTLLSLVGTVGAFLALRHSFGGGLDTQSGLGLLGIMFIVSSVLAIINIKRLQIEQHRAWMLRAWFYAGAIITSRIVMIIAVTIVSRIGGYYTPQPCDKLESVLGSSNRTTALYPECAKFFSGENPAQQVLVVANMQGTNPTQLMSAFNLTFGAAVWLAGVVHAIGIEIYLHLTPAEAERLRSVSYQRQVEAGMRHPGRAGITADRFGDAEPWKPRAAAKNEDKTSESDLPLRTLSP